MIKIVELEKPQSVQRKLVLFKVRAHGRARTGVLEIVDIFRAHVVDLSADTVVIEAVGSEQKINALRAALEDYGIEEIVQSGIVGIGRGSRSMTDQLKEK